MTNLNICWPNTQSWNESSRNFRAMHTDGRKSRNRCAMCRDGRLQESSWLCGKLSGVSLESLRFPTRKNKRLAWKLRVINKARKHPKDQIFQNVICFIVFLFPWRYKYVWCIYNNKRRTELVQLPVQSHFIYDKNDLKGCGKLWSVAGPFQTNVK